MRWSLRYPEQSASQLNRREVVDVLLTRARTRIPRRIRQPCEHPARPPIAAACGPAIRSQPFFSSPIRRMCGVYPAAVAAPSPVGLSYALSRGMCCGSSFVGSGRLTSDSLDRRCQEPPFQHVRPGDHHPQRSTVAIGHQALFRAYFFLGRWDSCPSFSPPKRALPSVAPRRPAATPTAPRRVRHTRRPRPPRFARRSLLQAQRWNQSWTVLLGSISPLGQLVPLAATAQPEDDRIQHFPPIGNLPPSRFLGPEFQEDRLDPPPQLVGDFPDRTQRFASRLPADHGSVSCRYARKWSLLATSSFMQKVFRRFSDSYLTSDRCRRSSSLHRVADSTRRVTENRPGRRTRSSGTCVLRPRSYLTR